MFKNLSSLIKKAEKDLQSNWTKIENLIDGDQQ